MIAPIGRGLCLALALFALGQIIPNFASSGFVSSALACACCTNEGQRNVATVALDSGKREEIERLRFGGNATLRIVGGSPRADWAAAFPRFRAVRDGVDPQ